MQDNIMSHYTELPLRIRELISDGTLQAFCSVLENSGQLGDFGHLITNITKGNIPPENICWLLNLPLGKLMSLDSTTQMRWHKDILNFFL